MFMIAADGTDRFHNRGTYLDVVVLPMLYKISCKERQIR